MMTTVVGTVTVGGKFGLTVTVKERVVILLLVPPSLTETVMMTEPLALVTGLKVSAPAELGLV